MVKRGEIEYVRMGDGKYRNFTSKKSKDYKRLWF